MIEVEVKLPVEDLVRIREKLTAIGFQRKQLLREEDHYYDTTDGRIQNNGEAIRIRKTMDLLTKETETMVTFKGKKVDQVSMTRTELETAVGDGETMHRIFEALGYAEVPPTVIKERDELAWENMNACLDEVEGLGSFLELEIVIGDEEDKEAALARIEEILKSLGYTLSDTIRTSYLTLLERR